MAVSRGSRLQEYLMANPMYSMGSSVSKAGTSTEPVHSTIEGIARALQGGIGGLMQGYAMGEAKASRKKDTESALALLSNKDPTKEAELLAAAGDHPDIVPLLARREEQREKLAAAMEARQQQVEFRKDMIRLTADLRQGRADPNEAADIYIRRQAKVDENRAKNRPDPAIATNEKIRLEEARQRMKDEAAAIEGQRRSDAAARALGINPPEAPPVPAPTVIPQGGNEMLAPGDVARQQGKSDSTKFDILKVNMDGRTWRGDMPVLNELWKGVEAAAAGSKNPDIWMPLHERAVLEAKTHYEKERTAKDFVPIFNSRNVQVGQRNRASGQETYRGGGGPEGKDIPEAEMKILAKQAGPAKEFDQLVGSAPAKVGGYKLEIIGDIDNLLKRNVGKEDPEGEAQWWQRYASTANLQRNAEFGSQLTGNEIKAWNKAAVNPGMLPDEIKKNLTRQAQIARHVASRTAHALAIQGMNPAAIEAKIGYKFDDLPSPFATYADTIPDKAAPAVAPTVAAPPVAVPPPTGVRKYNPAPGGTQAGGVPSADAIAAEIARRKEKK